MKRIIILAAIISLIALGLSPLLQSTGLATAPLSEIPKHNTIFLQNVQITSGSLLKLDMVKQFENS